MSEGLLEMFQARILATCKAQFPRACGNCGKVYQNFQEWIVNTKPVGAPMPDEIEDEDPIGLMSFVNCGCGSTLVLKCEDPDGEAHRAFNQALRAEAARTGRTERDILLELRERIRAAGAKGE